MTWRALAVALLSFVPLEAAAQGACLPHDQAVAKLEQRYGEQKAGTGLVYRASAVIEVFVNLDTGTWTILRTMPNGMSCVAAAGEYWMPEALLPGKGT